MINRVQTPCLVFQQRTLFLKSTSNSSSSSSMVETVTDPNLPGSEYLRIEDSLHLNIPTVHTTTSIFGSPEPGTNRLAKPDLCPTPNTSS
uniref:Uncharacterized protein n=1 Tax=Romanomermis culicivorax TaxID=13658 RepID=A0A915I0A0_ROMCU